MRAMERFITASLVVLICVSQASGQYDNVGSGRAIQFDGVDDYIDLGNIYDDIQFPLTISAWVYKDNSDQYILPVFVSQDNAALYNGFWFCLSATNLFFEYGDGRGEQSSSFRRGKSAPVPNPDNRWIYVSAVISSTSDVQLFANGYNLGGSIQGSSSEPMASNYPTDVAKVGYFHTNSVIHRYEGMIDELRIWNRALTENEIRENMCRRLKGDEAGLIGYWNFDETGGDQIMDLSPNGFHGVMNGNPTRVFSAAPLGDESAFIYSADWSAKTLTKDDLTVTKVSGNPFGVHIYSVGTIPSQTGGLDLSGIQLPYYGVFLADHGEGNTFDFAFSENICTTFQRADNSEPQWYASENFSMVSTRREMIRGPQHADLNIDLGDDVGVCDESSFLLQPEGIAPDHTILWSTGETGADITVTASGVYWIRVSKDCQVGMDSIGITFGKSPPSFSLGEDEVLCRLEPRTLTVDFDRQDVTFLWHDGSAGKSFLAGHFGTYWLKAENTCGVSIDSITFSKKEFGNIETYNFISPDTGDDLNQFLEIDTRLAGSTLVVFNRWGKQVYATFNYQNDWSGSGLAPGIYYYTLTNECIEPMKGVVTIMR